MSMTVARIVAEEAAAHELPIPPWTFAVIALLVFALLLGVLWSFRGTAQKYARPNLEGVREDATATGPGHPERDEPHWPEHPAHH